MVSVLRRKVRRELWRQRWQYTSVATTVVIGMVLFAASSDAFANLQTSYQRTYDRLEFADLTITGGDTDAFENDARATSGVAAVSTRREVDVPIRVDGDHKLLGRIVEVPLGARTGVNRVDLVVGEQLGPETASDVLAERHMADHFGIAPGAQVEVLMSTEWRTVDVSGVVVSAEYIWPARSRQDLLPTPDDFGVLFAGADIFDRLGSAPVDQVLVRFDDAVDQATIIADLSTAARRHGATEIETRAQQPSNAALQEDVAGFGELSFMFPALFLSAAGMATFVLLARLVRSQRTQIATLVASGLGVGAVTRHYLAHGVIVTGVSGVIGLAIGVPAGWAVTGAYTQAISVPDTVRALHPTTFIIGMVLSLLTGAVAAAVPAFGAARVTPGEALRGTAPSGSGRRSLVERFVPWIRRLPVRWRMVLRGIGRNPLRSLSTAGGVVLALALILASWGMVDTVDILVDRQFNDIQRQDAQLELLSTSTDSVAAIAAEPGIARAESVVQSPVTIDRGDQSYATQLVAFQPGTQMHDFDTVGLPVDGLIAGRSLGGLLDVEVGDSVILRAPGATDPIELSIAGFVDEPMGTFVYGQIDSLPDLGVDPSVMVIYADGVDRESMRSTLTSLPDVTAFVDARALYTTVRDSLSLFYVFVGIMLVFGAVMAFALLFNTSSVNVAERATELASMRVNGYSAPQISRLLAGENLALTVLATIPGLFIGYEISAFFMDSFSSDLFDFGLRIRWTTLAMSGLAVVAVSAISQWPSSRAVNRLDVAGVVRERSQ